MSAQVAFYARSSNDAHDVSCDSQLREFERLAAERGEVEVTRRVDSAVSHFEADGLTELRRFARSASPPPFERLYVWDTARISRILYRQAKTMFEFESAGVELCIVKLPSASSMAEINFLRNIHGSVDQYHSDNAAMEAKRGMAENIRQGWRAGGPAPYGYRLEYEELGRNRKGETIRKSRLVVDEEQAEVVREVYRRAIAGESSTRIADDLTTRGVKRARGGTKWNRSAVRNILANADLYLGHTIWNKTGDRQRRRGRKDVYDRPPSEWLVVKDTHPAIITEEEAARVKQSMGKRPGLRRRVTNPLQGLLRCGHCGRPLHSWGHGRIVCSSSARGEGYDLPGSTIRVMINAVTKTILGSIDSEQARERVAKEMVRLAARPAESPYETELRQVNRKITNWESVVADAATPREAQELYTRQLQPLYRQRDELECHRTKELGKAPRPLTLPEARRAVGSLFHDLQDASELDPDELARLFRAFVESIVVTYQDGEHQLEISWLPDVGFGGGGGQFYVLCKAPTDNG